MNKKEKQIELAKAKAELKKAIKSAKPKLKAFKLKIRNGEKLEKSQIDLLKKYHRSMKLLKTSKNIGLL